MLTARAKLRQYLAVLEILQADAALLLVCLRGVGKPCPVKPAESSVRQGLIIRIVRCTRGRGATAISITSIAAPGRPIALLLPQVCLGLRFYLLVQRSVVKAPPVPKFRLLSRPQNIAKRTAKVFQSIRAPMASGGVTAGLRISCIAW